MRTRYLQNKKRNRHRSCLLLSMLKFNHLNASNLFWDTYHTYEVLLLRTRYCCVDRLPGTCSTSTPCHFGRQCKGRCAIKMNIKWSLHPRLEWNMVSCMYVCTRYGILHVCIYISSTSFNSIDKQNKARWQQTQLLELAAGVACAKPQPLQASNLCMGYDPPLFFRVIAHSFKLPNTLFFCTAAVRT